MMESCQFLATHTGREQGNQSWGMRRLGDENLKIACREGLDARWVRRMVPTYYGHQNNICMMFAMDSIRQVCSYTAIYS